MSAGIIPLIYIELFFTVVTIVYGVLLLIGVNYVSSLSSNCQIVFQFKSAACFKTRNIKTCLLSFFNPHNSMSIFSSNVNM